MTIADAAAPVAADLGAHSAANPDAATDHGSRETVESIVVAVILAFLFRAFVAEAFVIPTGSMAPTLQGRHMDIVCSQCGHQYRTGASVENDLTGERAGRRGVVSTLLRPVLQVFRDTEEGDQHGIHLASTAQITRTRCPLCNFTTELDKKNNPNHKSFNGDRILVSKFAYQLDDPERWDVIVFKYPGEAKINYIKRLIGLPGETIRIRHGDIYTLDKSPSDDSQRDDRFQIARKPPHKVLAMLQVVDDTMFISQHLRDGLWPPRWTATQAKVADGWHRREDHRGFAIQAGSTPTWLRYRHLVPRAEDWDRIKKRLPYQLANYRGQLITDYYAYNDGYPSTHGSDSSRDCWVGDLAIEANVEIQSGAGEVTLDLVEGGSHFQCTIDVSTGAAQLSIDDGRRSFGASSAKLQRPLASTNVRGPGHYSLRLANVDDQLFLWVNDVIAQFNGPTTFDSPPDVAPRWSASDSGDLSPAGIAARGIEMQINRLRILRDVYYRAVQPVEPYWNSEYDSSVLGYGFDVAGLMASPQEWSATQLFKARRSVTFHLDADQFFPLGDNSPESRDARIWSERSHITDTVWPPPYVERELLIGKALFVYWPHSWRMLTDWLPVVPNFQRISRIR